MTVSAKGCDLGSRAMKGASSSSPEMAGRVEVR